MNAAYRKHGEKSAPGSRPSVAQRLRTHLRRGREAEEGVASIEFALLFPFMIILMLGSVEVFLMSMASRKMTRVTNTVGDLITQSKGTLTKSTIESYYKAAKHIMGKFPTSDLALSIYTFKMDTKTHQPKLDWKHHLGGYQCKSSTPSLTADQINSMRDGNDLVLTYGCYRYSVRIGRIVFGNMQLKMEDEISLRPRQRMRVPCSDCS